MISGGEAVKMSQSHQLQLYVHVPKIPGLSVHQSALLSNGVSSSAGGAALIRTGDVFLVTLAVHPTLHIPVPVVAPDVAPLRDGALTRTLVLLAETVDRHAADPWG